MSADRQLLEDAARAAGLDAYWDEPRGSGYGCLRVRYEHGSRLGEVWNPITNDGDALRLAVKLRMRINVGGAMTAVVYYTELGADSVEELFGSDMGAATRRAIVRAAAEIGKAREMDQEGE